MTEQECIKHYDQGYAEGVKSSLPKEPVTFDIDGYAINSIYRSELSVRFEGDYRVIVAHPKALPAMKYAKGWIHMAQTLTEFCGTNIVALEFAAEDRADVVLRLVEA
jgi:hypothetical protein